MWVVFFLLLFFLVSFLLGPLQNRGCPFIFLFFFQTKKGFGERNSSPLPYPELVWRARWEGIDLVLSLPKVREGKKAPPVVNTFFAFFWSLFLSGGHRGTVRCVIETRLLSEPRLVSENGHVLFF